VRSFTVLEDFKVKIIVGLGNPGKKYEQTRHNAGFWVIDELARRMSVSLNSKKFHSIIAEGHYLDEKVILVKPQTFMNLSGTAVQTIVRYWPIDLSDLLVIYDDLDLEPYRIRMRAEGSSGGHKGMQSIINQLQSQAFPRLKIGIGRPEGPMSVPDYVLAKISDEEMRTYQDVVARCADAVEVWISSGIEQAMNQYNSSRK